MILQPGWPWCCSLGHVQGCPSDFRTTVSKAVYEGPGRDWENQYPLQVKLKFSEYSRFLVFCFLNVIISKIKSEYSPHEPKCVFFSEQAGSFPLASCRFPLQVLRSEAGMQSFTFSLQVLLIKEALRKKHFSPVLINQINKNKNFCQAICFCSYPSTGLK